MKIPVSLLEAMLKYFCSKQVKDHIEISDRRLEKRNVSTSGCSSLIFFNIGFTCAHTEIGSSGIFIQLATEKVSQMELVPHGNDQPTDGSNV
jgi:hypothetical protein